MADKKKILLIDDDQDFLLQAKVALESGGYEVETASSGKEGVERFAQVRPDLAIIDMMMESYSEGFAVVDRVRALPGGNVPLILLSAVDVQGPYQSYAPSEQSSKVDLVLQKPIKAKDLLRYAGNLLAERRG
jgi:two-component system alkaline phosphatase synthesis response regulator PhoP